MTVWANIDRPRKEFVVHRETCMYNQKKSETPLKGVGKLKRDGGWLAFSSTDVAEERFRREFREQGYLLKRMCARCPR